MTTTRREVLATLASTAFASALTADLTKPAPLMPADPPRALPTQKADLGTLLPEVQKLAESAPFRGAFLSGKYGSFDDFRQQMRAKVLECLLYKPEPVAPKAEVIDKQEREDHIRERVIFSTSPSLRVPAYVLIPKGLKKPAPAIIDLHSHGGMFLFGKEKVLDLGQNHPIMVEYQQKNYDGRPTATALVRRGYVVITIDAFMFGERRIMLEADQKLGWDRALYSPEVVRQLNAVCRGKESTIVKGLTFAGLTWPGIVFWDDMRTIDYLVTRPEVDAKRLGCLGISMGGYRSLYLTALDERIRAGCVTGFMSSVRPMLANHLDTHSFVHFLPGLHQLLDLPDVASLAGHRALMVQQCSQDGLFPLAGMKESLEKIDAVFAKLGRAEHFAGRFYDVPHRFTLAMQDEAFAWLDRYLQPGT